jgi:uncharacterized membrane-anchored protein YitT (DUF2179 family)
VKQENVFTAHILPFLLLTVGAAVAAFALEEFLVPFTILDGGIVGVSMILAQLTPLKLGLYIVVLNVPFLLLGLKRLGWRFLVRALYAMVLFSVLLEVFAPLPAITDQDLLVVVFGGVLLGLGVGLILRAGGCLDGTEALAIMISRKINVSVGQFVLILNVLIYLTAGALFGLDRALYSLMTYFSVSKVEDLINTGMQQGKAVMIITDHGREIADDIYRSLGRTVTLIPGSGLISGDKTVVYCVVTRIELSALRRLVGREDYKAFMTVSDVSEIVGSHIKSTSVIRRSEQQALPDDVVIAEDGDGT